MDQISIKDTDERLGIHRSILTSKTIITQLNNFDSDELQLTFSHVET